MEMRPQKKPHGAVRQNADSVSRPTQKNTGLNDRQRKLQIRPSALLHNVRNTRICKAENTIVARVSGLPKGLGERRFYTIVSVTVSSKTH